MPQPKIFSRNWIRPPVSALRSAEIRLRSVSNPSNASTTPIRSSLRSMDSDPQNDGVRCGGGCFFLDEREAGFEGCFLGETVLPLGLALLLEGFGLLIGIGNSFLHGVNYSRIIAQMVCFPLGYNCFVSVKMSSTLMSIA